MTREAAFYYPGVIWRDPGWVKSLALFFDEVALLVPDYMHDRPFDLDPSITAGLEEAGMLRILSAESLVDRSAAERLASAMADVLAEGGLDALPQAGPFQELSWSRLGGFGDPSLTLMLFEELQERGLARHSADGVSIPLHPVVRTLILVLLAQILRVAGPRLGLELFPATDRPEVHATLVQLLDLPSQDSTEGQVVSFDLDFVAPRLDAVPLDEVVSFRAAHGAEYRAYARRMRAAVREIAAVEPEARDNLLADRRAEMIEAGEALRRGPLRTFGAVAGIGLGVAGGIASIKTGDVVGGVLSASAAVAGAAASPPDATTAFSYLFAIQQRFA